MQFLNAVRRAAPHLQAIKTQVEPKINELTKRVANKFFSSNNRKTVKNLRDLTFTFGVAVGPTAFLSGYITNNLNKPCSNPNYFPILD
jgi:hypothetical protein